MAKRFFGTTYDGTPIMRDVEADIAEGRKLLASMTREEFIRHLRKMGCLNCIMMLNNGEASTPAFYRDCYHPTTRTACPIWISWWISTGTRCRSLEKNGDDGGR